MPVPRLQTEADLQLLAGAAPLTIQQRTPTRVQHRRADLVREKMVHEMSAQVGHLEGVLSLSLSPYLRHVLHACTCSTFTHV